MRQRLGRVETIDELIATDLILKHGHRLEALFEHKVPLISPGQASCSVFLAFFRPGTECPESSPCAGPVF